MSERFWLITEPARGLSIRVPVPDNMLPDEALEHFAARDGYTIGEAYIKWRRESEMTSLSNFIADETDDSLTFHEVTREATVDPNGESPGKAFETWRKTKTPSEDLGVTLSDASLEGTPGFVYAGGGYIEDLQGHPEATARYHLLIGREDWLSEDYDELEHRLFFCWALGEGYTS